MSDKTIYTYVFQSREDAIDAAYVLDDARRATDIYTVISTSTPLEAEQRLRSCSVKSSGRNKVGELTGEPRIQGRDLWVNIRAVRGPDGLDVDLHQRIDRAIEDAELERFKAREKKLRGPKEPSKEQAA